VGHLFSPESTPVVLSGDTTVDFTGADSSRFDHLVAAYGFEEGVGGSTADDSGNGHTGTINGTAWSTEGYFGRALLFENANDRVHIDDAPDLQLTDFTLEAWVKLNDDAGGNWKSLIVKEGGGSDAYAIWVTDDNGHPRGYVNGNSTVGLSTISKDVWTHIAYTYDGTDMKLYVNGVIDSQRPWVIDPTTLAGPLTIGDTYLWPGEETEGLIDEVRVYNTPLDVNEIRADMALAVNNEVRDISSNLLASYSFEEETGVVVNDSSGNGNHGSKSPGQEWTQSGIVGGALVFDGNDLVSVPHDSTLDLTDDYTIQAWVYPAPASSWSTTIMKKAADGASYVLYGANDTDGKMAALVDGTSMASASVLPENRWSHIAFAYQSGTGVWYINGVEDRTQAMPDAKTSAYGLTIGGNTFWPGQYFKGLIDEVRIYNTFLYANELQTQIAAPDVNYAISGVVTDEKGPVSGVALDGGALGSTTSAADGSYSFSGVAFGTDYVITPSLGNHTFISSTASGRLAGNITHNFLAIIDTYPITGTVRDGDGTGLLGIVIDVVVLGTETTDSSGTYTFPSVPYGTNYNLTPQNNSSSEGMFSFSPTSISGTLTTASTHDFTATLNTYFITGTVRDGDGTGLLGIIVDGGALGTRTTDSSGAYTFTGVPYGTSYTLTPENNSSSEDPFIFSPASASGSVSADVTLDFVAATTGYEVSGTVRLSNLAGSPLSGVEVSSDGKMVVTDSEGNYLLSDMLPGTYTVTAALTGYAISPAEGLGVVVEDRGVWEQDFSAKPRLSNPTYAMWNGFLGMVNVLEVMNLGQEDLGVELTVLSIDGESHPLTWSIPAMTQRDIVLNDVPGFEENSYGAVRVECSHDKFDGRVLFYYPDTSGGGDSQYGFAYADALRNASTERSAVMYNTYHPGANMFDPDNTVYSWLSIANLEGSSKGFAVRRYNMNGEFITETRTTVPPLGRRDLEGGHVNPGPNNVGMNVIIPDDSSAQYLANLVRYAEGSNFDDFDYSFTLPARAGASRTVNAPVSTAAGLENYVEVANLLDEELRVHLRFVDETGVLVAEKTAMFPPLAQRHYNVMALLDDQRGYVAITSDKASSILAQSVFYHRSSLNRSIETAYASLAREAFGNKLYSTYNFFHGMKNLMRIINLGDNDATISYALPADEHLGLDEEFAEALVPSQGTNEFQLFDASAARANTYGIVAIETDTPGIIVSELMRIKRLNSGKYEFAIDIPAR